jgi:hypothetical protein
MASLGLLKHKAIVARVRHPAWDASGIPRDDLFPTALTPLRSGTIHDSRNRAESAGGTGRERPPRGDDG